MNPNNVKISGPHSISYRKLVDLAQSVLDAPDVMISDMRYGPANGIAGDLTNDEGEHVYKWYLFTTKGQINIDIQENVSEILETKKEEENEDGEHSV